MNVKCWKLINVQCTCMGKLELMNEWLKNVANQWMYGWMNEWMHVKFCILMNGADQNFTWFGKSG